MASTPSKIPTKGRPVRESKLTPVSRVPHRDASGKRRSELVSPKVEAVKKTRTPPSSAGSAAGTPGSSLRQPASSASSSSPSVDVKAKAKSANVPDDYAELKKENASLKKELQELKSLHNQLLQEGPSESFVKKRVDLLKTQVVQLERQIVLLTQALSSRTELMVDLQVMLESLLGSLEENVKEEGKGEVLKLASALNNRLTKHSQESSLDHLALPLQFLEDFVQPKKSSFTSGSGDNDGADAKTAATVLDICSGRTDHINLKQLNRLESKLMELYGGLTQLQSSLEVSQVGRSPTLLRPMEEHICQQVTQTSEVIGECCQALLCFSLLVPSPPSPPLKGTEKVTLEFSASSILKKLPVAVRNKKEVREVIEAAATAMSHHYEMNRAKCQVLEKELQFHKAAYDLQISYIGSLFKAVRDGYETFEESVQESLCSPLHELLEGYGRLSQTASDEALRDFLEIIQKYHKQLKQALDSFSKAHATADSEATSSESPQGVEALSLYGQHFFEQLAELEAQCDHTRHQTLTNPTPVVQDNDSTVS